MDEININFNLNSPQEKGKEIIICIENTLQDNLLYKFFIGCNGLWDTLQDFSENSSVSWIPEENGKYTIMIQAKKLDSNKIFDYVCRKDFIIGEEDEKLIYSINIDKNKVKIGEKINITVNSNKVPIMYRYWLREDSNWNMIKDYSAENTLRLTTKKLGKSEVLVECKEIDSKNNYDDFSKVEFNVMPLKNIEIKDFKCLSTELLCESDLVFQVDVDSEDNRTILYKFIKIYSDGTSLCIQDYSTKRIVSYVENEGGEYKLLCYVRDMYSQREYDDRAIMNFKVKKYKEIQIKSFTTDKISPQICESEIVLKSVVYGGRELLYRYIIDGDYGEDSGYIRNDTYSWLTKKPGEYKITLLVKDSSYDGNYEAKEELTFIIDEKSKEPINIDEIILDKGDKILKNDALTIKVKASGGMDLRYSFIVKKNDDIKEQVVDYGTTNWIRFIPKEIGKYQFEVRVKDKFSTRLFDSHSIIYVDVFEYFPASIDYVLCPIKESFLCGDNITVEVITTNTKDTLIKYILKINGHKVEESDFSFSTKYMFTPKCGGLYIIQIYAKNKNSKELFDTKKDIKILVNEALPVTDTKIKCNKNTISENEPVIFSVENSGGKDNMYEFYIMEKEEWIKVQDYSKKNYYSFIPFSKGKYNILALCKSSYKKSAYEDYDIFQFHVE
ncbi:triple tyrosine motif-containing protein [Clostridium lundense]|uniref:triple tyrosine motif-containing protein n=1 Tax=Clostridium lundense TaxID=319475 RepID=UPI00048A3E9E|nr:triple tyrosine motif-containing protein [Clostridium lundense]